MGGEDAERGGEASVVSLASKRENTRRNKPSFIYRHYSQCGRLLYIGITSNVKARTSAHRATSKWFTESTQVEVGRAFPSYYLAAEAEQYAILTEGPDHNARHGGYRGGKCSPAAAKRNVLLRAEYEARIEDARRSRGPDAGHVDVAVRIHRDYVERLEKVVAGMQRRRVPSIG